MSTEALPTRFEDLDGRILLRINPRATAVSATSSTRAETAFRNQQIGELFNRFGDRIVPLENHPSRELRKSNLYAELRLGDVVVTCGGDGTINEEAENIKNYPQLDKLGSENAKLMRSTPMYVMKGGKANNLGNDLTPLTAKGEEQPIVDGLFNSLIIPGFGSIIRVTSDHPDSDGVTEFSAISCHSIEVGGHVGNALETVRDSRLRKYKQARRLVDARAAYGAIKNIEPIEMLINGVEVEAIGSIGCNTSTYLGELATPASIHEPAFYERTIAQGGLVYLTKTVAAHQRGKLPWRRVEADELLTYEVTAKAGQQLYLETDAEPHKLPMQEEEETNIIIQIHPDPTPIRVFTTNPDLILRASKK